MKDEEDDNILPEGQEEDNSINENQSEEKTSKGQHFYDNQEDGNDTITKVTGMYKDWFLDYASYVILERAVPAIEDGFKPVQRRIMHSLKELDDGRYNKVANVVGHTMQYHPHGDQSIGDAMVQIGQKELLIDCQGNWGNILTGDGAAASRYIEARLSKFALEVLYSPKITDWGVSYDGRRAEPNNLPVKFPLLLASGAEGIAVGLSTKVLPHNFNELIDSSIKILKGKPFTLYPDFLTQGIADVSNYNDGLRGGRIRVRARISQLDKNTLVITQIPFSTNTTTLIDSILKANEKGKIKIKKIEDNTAAEVEILIHLFPGVSPDKTIDALFAFTACETSVAPLGCVIEDNKPLFIGVSAMLKISTNRTVQLLKSELEIQLSELEEQWHFLSLERIFIENKIYRDIEEQTTKEGVIKAVDDGLKPYIKHLKRAVTEDDILRLLDIRIMRISKFDSNKAQDKIQALEGDIEQVKHDLEHLIDFAIAYFTRLKEKYGKGRERQTELRVFDDIEATKVVLRNTKLYVNREEGFVGTSLKKDEYVTDCSDIDDVIVFLRDGKMIITKVDAKTFVGKDIIHIAIFDKSDKRTIYNTIYRDGKSGPSYIKRFNVSGVTRDKAYDLTNESTGSQVVYFSCNPNGEAEVITIMLRQVGTVKKLKFDIDFASLAIKGRGSKGNLVTKYPIKKIELKEKGISTLLPRKVWFDETVQRLNVDGRGELLGEFRPNDKILILSQSGKVKVITPELSTHFDEDMIVLEKWIPKKPISAIYYDGEKERYYIKRFLVETENKEESFITEHANSHLEIVSTEYRPVAELVFTKVKGVQKENITVDIESFIALKGFKALGNQLTADKLKQVNLLDSLPYEAPEEIIAEELEVKGETNADDSGIQRDDDGQIILSLE
ncbi:DNA gyrase/topoisomerase IV subunit A [Flavobacterium sp. GSP27]|uniref:DNA gyrase/topoisomerase IV subunit A n=1 Tax=Flavobacterium bomense TaxID=2497483 RepID=A0A3S0MA54_9FLAO|nr:MULTISPECIES: DNA gyrase/topoisomerase IV subunit A [Flavobacterium]RTY94635.1 DNA gyrase/topoisomerase IV subunit A [Flavobacterium sp. GSN2]RTY66626.1 DNA gyrase/topoisomerase IV subunit A [Flavobacterium sp. LB2P53]RTY73236.1 DNA gyrase/topoisomerase IV subunit A [Flavobacterium sp. LS1R10]RTY82404.1 DNA gyrase/topoisomerase IV subunit A [Flavobacterium sp. LS1P28]RTZ02001.1 DNA gyrase/topoisomerase IV subunit A [Flavobacterium bomense]